MSSICAISRLCPASLLLGLGDRLSGGSDRRSVGFSLSVGSLRLGLLSGGSDRCSVGFLLSVGSLRLGLLEYARCGRTVSKLFGRMGSTITGIVFGADWLLLASLVVTVFWRGCAASCSAGA